MTEAGGDAAARGQTLLRLGRPAEAAQLLRTALRSDPGNADLLRLLAAALIDTDLKTEAREVAERAVAADPDDVTGLSCLAAVLWLVAIPTFWVTALA